DHTFLYIVLFAPPAFSKGEEGSSRPPSFRKVALWSIAAWRRQKTAYMRYCDRDYCVVGV
ncbi:MAG TPA: hypothetical protein P5568_13175, partial [Acidobacteriota bacterium]|nr:hypothetical protein [Acidobacteriota bacterium]